jgi:cyanophycin synthetase
VPSDPLAAAQPVADAPEVPESVLIGGMQMIRDERGVRLSSEPEEAD